MANRTEGDGARPDASLPGVLRMLDRVMGRLTADTSIGRILMPGPTYLGIWARDTGVAALGLNRLGKTDLSGELLTRYWSYQITPESDPATFIFRNKRFSDWTEADAFRPSKQQLLGEVGAFPTSVYIQTPDFPAGTREIYTVRADPDSVAWLVIALNDYYRLCHDLHTLQHLAPQVASAMSYLLTRDLDGDHLLEQGANQDWSDTLLREGKVAYTQAVWFGSLVSAAQIFDALSDEPRSRFYREKSRAVQQAINHILLTPLGYYADLLAAGALSMRRSLDTALLLAFRIPAPEVADAVLHNLRSLEGPFGVAVVEPGYAPAETGPAKYPPGQYHNEGIWPWITAYYALAHARSGYPDRARELIHEILRANPETIHEWIDNRNGEPHHPDFATGAGALAWAITEGELATWAEDVSPEVSAERHP